MRYSYTYRQLFYLAYGLVDLRVVHPLQSPRVVLVVTVSFLLHAL